MACRAANGNGSSEMNNLQQKYDEMVSRQGSFKWGGIYTPCTLAVPKEAPKGSRISRLNSRSLGRTIHALSTPERVFVQFALYNPALIDIHEQKMLSPVPTVHPLRGHPLATESFPPPLSGTLAVAKAIGLEHYTIVYEYPNGERKRKPFPHLRRIGQRWRRWERRWRWRWRWRWKLLPLNELAGRRLGRL